MKLLFSFIFFILVVSCNMPGQNDRGQNKNRTDTIIKHDTVYLDQRYDWQQGFELTHDPEVDSVWFKPVKFYIDDPDCSGLAIDFYYGAFRPSDDRVTDELLKLTTTNNAKLRPFYRWCVTKTLQLADGGLAESIGEPAWHYIEKFPKEFFEYAAEDTSNARYNLWIDAINYSCTEADSKKNEEMMNKAIKTMKKNCTGCSSDINKKIEQLAKDCFSASGQNE
jgi:hypothetical protein